MDVNAPESASGYEDPEVRKGANYKRNPFWGKAKDVLLAELYTEFVPRWFKKRDEELPNYEMKAVVAWLSPALKFGIGIGLYPLSTALDFGSYETVIRGVSVYLAADGVYQLFDLRHPYSEGLRRAATLALDLLTSPFYVISSRTRHGQAPKS